MGLTWLKMDLGINMVAKIPGTVTMPSGETPWERNQLPHPFTAAEVTDKGIEKLCEYVAAAREAVGMEIPLSMDHLGHIGVNSIIRLGKAYEKYNLSWMEDVIPWQYTDLLQHITMESPTPILTGEDIYLKEGFINLCEKHAVSKIHPDISTSGGILETHKIGDAAMEYGVPMAMHYAGTADRRAGQRALRRGHRKLPGLRKSFAGRALVAGPGRRHREAHHQQGLHHRA